MSQYGTGSCFLDVVVADFSYPLWRSDLQIDAVITDRKYNKIVAQNSRQTKYENPWDSPTRWVVFRNTNLTSGKILLCAAPYGIREATERVGTMKLNPMIEEHQVTSHIPSKIDYGLNQIYKDLLCFSAKHLRLDGRLVCWYPLFRYISMISV